MSITVLTRSSDSPLSFTTSLIAALHTYFSASLTACYNAFLQVCGSSSLSLLLVETGGHRDRRIRIGTKADEGHREYTLAAPWLLKSLCLLGCLWLSLVLFGSLGSPLSHEKARYQQSKRARECTSPALSLSRSSLLYLSISPSERGCRTDGSRAVLPLARVLSPLYHLYSTTRCVTL